MSQNLKPHDFTIYKEIDFIDQDVLPDRDNFQLLEDDCHYPRYADENKNLQEQSHDSSNVKLGLEQVQSSYHMVQNSKKISKPSYQ